MGINYILQLKELLNQGSLTQIELAKRLQVTFAALSRWIHGHAKPRPSHIQAIEKLYKEIVGYPAITDEQLKKLIRQANGLKRKGLWKAITMNEAVQDDLLLEHTYNSTTIEGTTFTKRETEALIFNNTMRRDKSYIEHLEVTNHAAALRDILKGSNSRSETAAGTRPSTGSRSGPSERITESLIKHLHLRLLQGIRPDAGEYSKHHRAIRGVDITLTHPSDIPEEIQSLVKDWSKPGKHDIRDIATFHAHFELIHPFGDGNGRVGRLLMAIQCLEQDYPPIVIENERKADYYDVLEYAQRKSEGPLVSFLVEEMEKTAKMIRKYL